MVGELQVLHRMLVSRRPLLFKMLLANDEQLRKGLSTSSHTMAYA